ncbi:MAG: hypothetical protein ACOY0T_11135 [Myxococcota bacterium]
MANDDTPRDSDATASADVALIHGLTESGDLRILRQREGRVELGQVRPLREGVPISGEVVRLTPRKEFPLLCDVTTELALPAASPKQDVVESQVASHKGPAQVATDRYRQNWDLIWKRPAGDERAN